MFVRKSSSGGIGGWGGSFIDVNGGVGGLERGKWDKKDRDIQQNLGVKSRGEIWRESAGHVGINLLRDQVANPD